MNLHAIAGPIVGAVNPTVAGKLWTASGYATDAAGRRSATYVLTDGAPMQIQALAGPELAQVESLNIEGVKRAVYLYGDTQGAVRADGRGGDLLDFGGHRWLVVAVLETWPDWCKVAVAMQTDDVGTPP